ncbi:hypothetical protein TPHA_0M01060 [Tetrapisispora phaffii CBS 4417]|uniref:Glycoside hydrolase family 5 domain-containing protein n=1 Tax=Tetrapisispora phaffii (strain ATCC 24235 / CBS 4417 / NBRC 1672 / NRRL Y-8282 / UCD 70-5) TaxID=1071381 RepID=G8C0G5_TETPH|nr:hypothetical protein TPHA_0M01060 [Tetrapisispora phaffii CBS 4417]CCE65680.1 hypothetical protein TPHA_0M01060 [Tetrapisispora phaffii CBS 4417]
MSNFNQPPNIDQIFKYRTNYGVNLGSLFVLESWIYGDLFDKGGASELDAIRTQVKSSSVAATAAKLAKHYNDYISSIAWDYLANKAGTTALRVPIGYWHVNNGNFTKDTVFSEISAVYQAAKPWDILKRLIDKANSYQIGILIDLHGLPGGANSAAHSGSINQPPTFFDNNKFKSLVIDNILPFIVKDVCINKQNVIGLQIVNEADFNEKAVNQKDYYIRAVSKIRNLQPTLPVIISDGWWPDQFSNWVKDNNLVSNVVIDTHIYRCYSDSDKSKNANQIISELKDSINIPADGADFVVGEYSCVLDEQTWQKTSGDRGTIIKNFGLEQNRQFKIKSSWGWFFWTLQFKYGDGGEWGYIPQCEKGNIFLRVSNQNTIPVDQNRIESIIKDHINYWKDKGGDKMEHWRYIDGIYKAAYDIQAFQSFKNSSIGRWVSWTKLRRDHYVALKGNSAYMWEYDQGYARGLQEFNKR